MKTANIHLFWAKVSKSDGCWLWTAYIDRAGYGKLILDKRTRGAHQVSYEQLVGLVPAGLQLDHLCRNRACVNPAHLEPVTHRVNVLRGVGVGARNAAKKRCDYGHDEFRLRRGKRICLACDRRRQREYSARIKS